MPPSKLSITLTSEMKERFGGGVKLKPFKVKLATGLTKELAKEIQECLQVSLFIDIICSLDFEN